MPSFAFWKSSKNDDVVAPLLHDSTTRDAEDNYEDIYVPKKRMIDLDAGERDSGVFLFDEVEEAAPLVEAQDASMKHVHHRRYSEEKEKFEVKTPLLVNIKEEPDMLTAQLPPTIDTVMAGKSAMKEVQTNTVPAILPVTESSLQPSVTKPSPSLEESFAPVSEDVPQKAQPNTPIKPRQPSFSDDEERKPFLPTDSLLRVRSESTASTKAPVRPISPSPTPTPKPSTQIDRADSTTSIQRLRRPAELNLGPSTGTTDTPKARSELEKRHDLIRASKTQSKAALRSPTQLLQERLNMVAGAKKQKNAEEVVRVFTPPVQRPGGCVIPGPGKQEAAFTSGSVRARTVSSGRPAWYCKTDKLVVFDAHTELPDGTVQFQTRSSKGLSIARRRGEVETVVVELPCAHCREVLGKEEWKFDGRVCGRGVCWECRERCAWEVEQETRERMDGGQRKDEVDRKRADSVLQDGKREL